MHKCIDALSYKQKYKYYKSKNITKVQILHSYYTVTFSWSICRVYFRIFISGKLLFIAFLVYFWVCCILLSIHWGYIESVEQYTHTIVEKHKSIGNITEKDSKNYKIKNLTNKCN